MVRQDYEKLIKLVSKYFKVDLQNDWFKNPTTKRHNEMVYEYYYGKTTVGYLYYRLGKTDEYASFEFDPKYLGNETIDTTHFEVAPMRKNFPQAKLIFRCFEEVESDLENICQILYNNFSNAR